jgi:hypothetical protein
MSLDNRQMREAALLLQNDSTFYVEYVKHAQATNAERRRRYICRALQGSSEALWHKSCGHDVEQLRRLLDAQWGLAPANTDGDLPALRNAPDRKFWADEPSFDYSKLPDGAILFTEKGMRFIKGQPPGCNPYSDAAVIGYCLDAQGKFDGWQDWTADGATDTSDSPLRLVGYELVPTTDARINAETAAMRDDPNHPLPLLTTNETTMTTSTAPITIITQTLVNGTNVDTMPKAAIYQLIADQEAEIERLGQIKNKPKALKEELAKRQSGIDALVVHLDSLSA